MGPTRSVFERKGVQLACLGFVLLAVIYGGIGSWWRPAHGAHARSGAHPPNPTYTKRNGGAVNTAASEGIGEDAAVVKTVASAAWRDSAVTRLATTPAQGTPPIGTPTPIGGPREKTTSSTPCASIRSNYHESARFVGRDVPRRWGLNVGASRPGASLTMTRRGPVANPALCTDGCAVLSFVVPAGTGWGDGAIVDAWFPSDTNLVGIDLRAAVALELPRPNLPVNVRIFTQGGASAGYTWGTTASISTAVVADVSRFHALSLRVVDRPGKNPFCASATAAVGIQVQRSGPSPRDIPVKLYIRAIDIGTGDGRDVSDVDSGGTGTAGARAASSLHHPATFSGNDGYCRLASNGGLEIAGDDWVLAGTCQGYGYTYALGQQKDTKIVPSCGASRCTPRLAKLNPRGLCASGTLAADPTWRSKAGVGFDLDPAKSGTSGLALSYQMMGTAILRFIVEAPNGTQYCADLDETDENGSTVHLPWEFLSTRCWDRWEPGLAYDPRLPIKGVHLSASCRAEKSAWFDMCVTGLSTY